MSNIHVGLALATYLLLLPLLEQSTPAAEPRIDKIELLSTNRVTIHFGTDANRVYELQYLENGSGVWSNLFVQHKAPVTNHWIIPDLSTNRSRTYRLRVTS